MHLDTRDLPSLRILGLTLDKDNIQCFLDGRSSKSVAVALNPDEHHWCRLRRRFQRLTQGATSSAVGFHSKKQQFKGILAVGNTRVWLGAGNEPT